MGDVSAQPSNKRMQLTRRGGLVGVARFARQSSLSRASQLIRGVRLHSNVIGCAKRQHPCSRAWAPEAAPRVPQVRVSVRCEGGERPWAAVVSGRCFTMLARRAPWLLLKNAV
jgi:hypothetical protein